MDAGSSVTEGSGNQTTGSNELETVDQEGEMVPWWDIVPQHNTQQDLSEALQSDKHVIRFLMLRNTNDNNTYQGTIHSRL